MRTFKVFVCSSLYTKHKDNGELDWDGIIKDNGCLIRIICASSSVSALIQMREQHPYCQFKIESI